MTAMRDWGSDMLMLNRLIGGRAGITLVVGLDQTGQVLEAAGNGDHDGLAATVAMCDAALQEAAQALGLGEFAGWMASTEGASVFCAHNAGQLVAGMGPASRSAIAQLASVIKTAKGA